MNALVNLQQRVDDYLAERRRIGFQLRSRDSLLAGFARYVADRNHTGPLTADLMVDWARHDKGHRETPRTWAVRLAIIRHFARYLRHFEPDLRSRRNWLSFLCGGGLPPLTYLRMRRSSNCWRRPSNSGYQEACGQRPMGPFSA